MTFPNWFHRAYHSAYHVVGQIARELKRELLGRGTMLERLKICVILIAIVFGLVNMVVDKLTEVEPDVPPVIPRRVVTFDDVRRALEELMALVEQQTADLREATYKRQVIAFGIGVLASLTASVIFNAARRAFPPRAS